MPLFICLARVILFLALVPAATVTAQPAHRVKDINTGGNTTWPSGLTAAGGRLYFVADDGPHGRELWTSDGTGAGTTRIPGTAGATQPMKAGMRVFFMKGFDLWVSDGTPGGSAFVKALSNLPSEWVEVSGTLFFAVWGVVNYELWKSDGTGPGTLRVKEPNPGEGPLGVRQIVAANGRVFFYAPTRLWTSDGTSAGTYPVGTASAQSGYPSAIGVLGGSVFFSGWDSAHGSELWISDGSDTGTTLFADLEPGTSSSGPEKFVASGGRLFFIARTAGVGWRLWSTDGTQTGTVAVDSLTGWDSVYPTLWDLTAVAGRLCLRKLVYDELWTSDGTNAGTIPLKSGVTPNLTAAGSQLFFTVGSQLWVSDLTPSGTHAVRSFATTFTISGASFAEFGGLLYFTADDGVYGPQLWKSDGTAAGTTLVAILRPGPLGSYPFGFQELGGEAFFLASGNSASSDLWRTDGTEAGTTRAVDLSLAAYSGLVATSRRLFWLEGPAGGPSSGGPPAWLVTSDGTKAGTAPVAGPSGSVVYASGAPAAALEQVFFMGAQPVGDFSLWRADGTADGTRSLGPFPYGSFGPLCSFHDGVTFLVRPSGGSTELWRSDGTMQGTVRVKTLSTRPSPDCVGAPRRLGRLVVFLADDGSTGCNVWRSDGTRAGTTPLGVIGAGASALMDPMGSARGIFIFRNYTDVWRTDGTPAGTFLLKPLTFDALVTGAKARQGVYLAIRSNGTPEIVEQLWLTDGTVAGTGLLHDFQANGENARIASLTTANGRLLATVAEAVYPSTQSLWTSDGTPSGTVSVQAGVGASGPGFPYRGVTLFAGTDPWAGTELWAMDGASFAAPVRPASLSLLTPCRVLDTREATGFLGGPALAANAPRLFPVGDVCGIPSTARAIAANVTVTGATADGLLRVHASDIGAPEASVINFRAGQTRANNATIALGPDAEFTVRFEAPAGTGEVHVIVDVVGWYE